MLDFKTQSQLVDATASIMRAYLRAATNTAAASASRNLSLWTQMLEAAAPRQAEGQGGQRARRSATSSQGDQPHGRLKAKHWPG